MKVMIFFLHREANVITIPHHAGQTDSVSGAARGVGPDAMGGRQEGRAGTQSVHAD